MSINEPGSGLTGPAGRKNKANGPSLHPLHEAAMRIADLGLSRSRSRTRDIVGALLSHGARAWRSSQPSIRIHLHVSSQSGQSPIYLRLR